MKRKLREKYWLVCWIRDFGFWLEDAEKEIDRLKELLLKFNQEALDYEQKVENWKQKLQELSKCFPNWEV